MDAVRVAVLNEEFYRAGVPRVTRGMGEWLVGAVGHRARHAGAAGRTSCRGSSPARTRYCQGFSEPDHGSDLAAVETRGVVDGDEIVITGQKVWTSGAARANRMFLLCRTDPDVDKHAGLSYVLIDFTGPGRPVPADQADVRRGRVLRGLPGRGAGPAVQRHRRPEQRLEGGHDHARARARRPGHRGPPRLRAGVLGPGRDGPQARQDRRPADPPAAGLGLHAGRADAVQRPAHAGPGGGGPPAGPGGVGGQAVLERVPQAAGRDRDRHRGHGRPAPAGRRRLPGQQLAERVPEQPGRHDLLGDQRDPAQHHRRTRPRPAQGAAPAHGAAPS